MFRWEFSGFCLDCVICVQWFLFCCLCFCVCTLLFVFVVLFVFCTSFCSFFCIFWVLCWSTLFVAIYSLHFVFCWNISRSSVFALLKYFLLWCFRSIEIFFILVFSLCWNIFHSFEVLCTLVFVLCVLQSVLLQYFSVWCSCFTFFFAMHLHLQVPCCIQVCFLTFICFWFSFTCLYSFIFWMVFVFLLCLLEMEDLHNEIVPQVHALVDLIVEEQHSGILDDLNDPNFCGSTSTSSSIGYVSNLSITANANLSTIVITDEALWSLFTKQINLWKPKSGNATTWVFYAINNALVTIS